MYFRRLLLSMRLLRLFIPRNDASVLQKSGEDSGEHPTHASKMLGMDRKTLRYLIKKHNIVRALV